MKNTPTTPGLFCVLLGFLLTGAMPAGGDCPGSTHQDSFREGVKIRARALETNEKGKAQTYWAGAVLCFRAALSENTAEDRRRSVRVSEDLSEPYLPHFSLGWALFEMGNFEAARHHLSISSEQKQIQGHYHFARLERILRFLSVLDKAEEILLETERIQRDVEAVATIPLDTGFRDRRGALLEDLAQAWQAVDRARKSRQPEDADHALRVAERAMSTAILLQRRHRVVAPLEKILADAAWAYLDLRYKDALDILESSHFEDKAMALRGWMLRAGSHFALYLQAGRKSADDLEAAKRAVRECHRLAPKLEPPEDYFSPAFVTFYRQHAQI